jgi:hypothetical protein
MRCVGNIVALCALGFCGCDGQAGSDYQGTPLVVLHGSVVDSSPTPPWQPIDAALLWRGLDAAMPDAIMFATPLPVEKVFPASFTIWVYLPPPQRAYQGSLPYASANVGAIAHGATAADLANGTGILGRMPDPLLYYFKSDVLQNGLMAQHYGSLKRGYHLMTRHQTADPSTLTPSQIDACAGALVAESAGLARADAATECVESLLTFSNQELPLDTALTLDLTKPL